MNALQGTPAVLSNIDAGAGGSVGDLGAQVVVDEGTGQ